VKWDIWTRLGDIDN